MILSKSFKKLMVKPKFSLLFPNSMAHASSNHIQVPQEEVLGTFLLLRSWRGTGGSISKLFRKKDIKSDCQLYVRVKGIQD